MSVLEETPVTGTPGKRTPRDQIEGPVTNGREAEITWIKDWSGSNMESADENDPSGITKAELVEQIAPLLVGALASKDSQAAAEQAGGSDDKGGVLTIGFNEPGELHFDEGEDESDDPRFLGDLNESNVQEKLSGVRYEGRTYIMPAIRASERAFQAEFGGRPMRSRPTNYMLVTTDGKLSDPDEFEQWLAQADETEVVAVAVYGSGAGHDAAVQHYQALAAKNPYITVAALTAVTDPKEIAFDLMLLATPAPA
jgi:hypothetical protein